jgi:hypothetical protein
VSFLGIHIYISNGEIRAQIAEIPRDRFRCEISGPRFRKPGMIEIPEENVQIRSARDEFSMAMDGITCINNRTFIYFRATVYPTKAGGH